jgi:hypothetical protein
MEVRLKQLLGIAQSQYPVRRRRSTSVAILTFGCEK